MAAERERQLFVYRIQNRSARELAVVLQGMVAAETGVSAAISSSFGAYGGAVLERARPSARRPAPHTGTRQPSG